MPDTKYRIGWLTIALVLVVLSANVVQAQFFGFGSQQRPKHPAIALQTTSFPHCLNQGGILLGEIESIRFTGKAHKDNWHYAPHYEVSVKLKIERAILGKPFAEKSLTLPTLWVFEAPQFSPFREGDRVLFEYFEQLHPPEKFRPNSGPFLYKVEEDEITRLDRVAKILAMNSSEEAAQVISSGCFDPDPFFAKWCLLLTWDIEDKHNRSSSFLSAYGHLRRDLSPQLNYEICWELLQNPGTHSLVYSLASVFLRRSNLTPDQLEKLHVLHIQRFERLVSHPPSDPDLRYYALEATGDMLSSYNKSPVPQRLAWIAVFQRAMRETDWPELEIKIAYAACRFHDDGNEATWEAILPFLQQHASLQSDPNRIDQAFRHSLATLGEHELIRTKKLAPAILNHFENLFLLADEKTLSEAYSPLNEYVRTAKKVKLPAEDLKYLEDFLRHLHDQSPHPRGKNITRMILRKHFGQDGADKAL
ncbi:hypothetical protein AB1K70_08615 [Bremerella sp. JC770]|uniref:hypothetical protein n=1 Tax=Bremerella sp. JC770 TaxID=3232137 RepID=UPI00345A7C1C